jgi:hypothetical protein
MDSCLIYLATSSAPQTELDILQTKDRDTRRYAKLHATGTRSVTPTHTLEIIEAPMPIAEQLLDEITENPNLSDPEILLLAPIPKRFFKAWTLKQIANDPPKDDWIDTVRVLAQQATLAPDAIPLVIPKMLAALTDEPAHTNAA